jgi:YesN/AraC family two-component response regulator
MAKVIRMLVVDDEPHIRTSLKNYFEDEGFIVLTAESAEEALEILNNTPPDIVVVDIRLPKMDGNSMIIKAHRIRPNVQFIIFTGSSDYHLPASIERIGVSPEDVFYKPIPDLSVIAEAIHRKKKNKEVFKNG